MQDELEECETQDGLDEGHGEAHPETLGLMDILLAPYRTRARFIEVRL